MMTIQRLATIMICTMMICIEAVCVEPIHIMDWNQAIDWFRDVDADRSSGVAVYIGRRSNRVVQLLEQGHIVTAGLPIVVLSADADVINPMTNRLVRGSEIIRQFSTISQTNPAGSIFFLDPMGIPLPLVTIHHALHRNQPERINLMCAYAASGMTNSMSLEEFARLRGEGRVVMRMAEEIRSGELTEAGMLVMKHHTRELSPDTAIVATAQDGTPVHTGVTPGRIFLLTADPAGPAFLAQARDIWQKLTVHDGAIVIRPPLTIIAPPGSSFELLALQGIEHQTLSAPIQRLQAGPLPRMILSGGDGGVVVEVTGYIPGDVMGALLGVQVPHLTPLHPDMPLGEVDYAP